MSIARDPVSMEFWFDFGSNYSYIALMRVEALATACNVRVVLKPFLVGPVFKSLGWDTSPFNRQKRKGEYMWRDMERQCAKYAVPWKRPSVFPRRALLPMRVAIVAAEEPWQLEFCRRIMQRNFVADCDINQLAIVSEVLEELGQLAALWIAMAQSHDAKALLRAQSDEAARRGIFGAPMFFVGAEMFWGNDRLEDALALASTTPSTISQYQRQTTNYG